MVLGDTKGTKRSKRISSGPKKSKKLTPVSSLNKLQLPVEADPMPQKLFDNRMDTEEECIRNSKDMSEVTSEELEQMVNATASCIDYREAEDIVDSCKVEETFIEKHPPLHMDPNALVAEEEDIPKPMFEKYAQLKASIKKLQVENSMTCSKIVEMSESSVQLSKENRRLLKQLKKICTPDTIAYLEAQNPEKRSGEPGNF